MGGNAEENKIFVFGDYRLSVESQTLLCEDREIHLPKRPFQLLLFLIENRERVVSRDELLQRFWEGHDVYDDALRKAVSTIRRALNDPGKPPRLIETRYGSGFRFIGTVAEVHQNGNGHRAAFETKERENLVVKSNSKPDRRSFPYILTVTLLAGALFFVSLGFYVYRSQYALNQSSANLPLTVASVRSIAILPLKNLTGDANNEYFSDGVTENLITELSRVSELKVISRSSTFALKDKENDPRELGKKLKVDALLEGSVQKKGETISIAVRLVSARDGSVLWTSRDFERHVSSAYELQDTISCSIAVELRTELCGAFSKQKTENADAYQAYLKGRFQWNKRTAEGIRRSIELYDQAIKLDANYAPAYAGLSESYVQGIWHVPFEANEVLPKAEEAALKAVALDDSSAEAHAALAKVYELEWNWSAAEKESARAVELNPHSARAHHVQAFFFLTVGRNGEAVEAIRRAKELDPLNLVINTDEGEILFTAGRIDESFGQWRKTLELDPNFAMAYEHQALAYHVSGDEKAAIEAYAKAMQLNGKNADKIAEFRRIASKNGLKAVWQKDLRELIGKEKRGEKVSYLTAAIYHSLLGHKDEAFAYLEKSYQERAAEMILLKPYAGFTNLHNDPRYTHLLRRMKLL